MKADFRIITSLAMSSSSEKRIAAALYRRDPISSDPRTRRLYKHEAYHWGILIIQGDVYDEYEATDRNNIDPVTFRQENPAQKWFLHTGQSVDPSRNGQLLGRIIIGSIPSNKSKDDVKTLLDKVPLPIRNQAPQQSCVTWVANAIRTFHEAQFVPEFDVGEFLDWGLSYADKRLKDSEMTPGIVYYEEGVKSKEEDGMGREEKRKREK